MVIRSAVRVCAELAENLLSLDTVSIVFVTVCMSATAPHVLPITWLMYHTPSTGCPRSRPSDFLRDLHWLKG